LFQKKDIAKRVQELNERKGAVKIAEAKDLRDNKHDLFNGMLCSFDQLGGKKAKCKICKTLMSFDGSTTNLWKHLKGQHREEYVRLQALKEIKKSADSIIAEGNAKNNIKTFFPTISASGDFADNAISAAALFFADSSTPLRVVETPLFRNMLVTFARAYNKNGHFSIGRQSLTKKQEDLAKELEQVVQQRMKGVNTTLAIDAWSKRKKKFVNTNLVGRSRGESSLESSHFQTNALSGRSTAENLGPIIEANVRSAEKAGTHLVCITTDNEAAMRKAVRNVLADAPHILWQACMAHTLQLIYKAAAQHVDLKPVVDWITEITALCTDDKEFVLDLHDSQVTEHVTPIVVQPLSTTRWGSLWITAQSLLNLQPHITSLVNFHRQDKNIKVPVSPSAWDKVKSFVEFIDPLKQLTNEIQSDGATLFDAYAMVVKLTQDTLAQSRDPFFFWKDAAKHLHKVIKDKVLKLLSPHLMLAAGYLALEKKVDQFSVYLSTVFLAKNVADGYASQCKKEEEMRKVEEEKGKKREVEEDKEEGAGGRPKFIQADWLTDDDDDEDHARPQDEEEKDDEEDPMTSDSEDHEGKDLLRKMPQPLERRTLGEMKMRTVAEFVAQWGALYLRKHFAEYNDKTLQQLKESLFNTFVALATRAKASVFEAIDNEVDAASKRKQAKASAFGLSTKLSVQDRLNIWSTLVHDAPSRASNLVPLKSDVQALALVASAILEISPTEASTERSFSAQKFVFAAIRSRLSMKQVQTEMIIKMNGHLLNKKASFSSSSSSYFSISCSSSSSSSAPSVNNAKKTHQKDTLGRPVGHVLP
jgi:hypothetical protein